MTHIPTFFYILNCILLLTSLFGLRDWIRKKRSTQTKLTSSDRAFSLAMVRTLLATLLMAAQYFFIAYYFKNYVAPEIQAATTTLFSPTVIPLSPEPHTRYFQEQLTPFILFFETAFTLVWFGLACQLHGALTSETSHPKHRLSTQWGGRIEIAASVLLVGLLLLNPFGMIETYIYADSIVFPAHSLFFYADMLLLLTMLFMAWRLENFWRCLSSVQRWEYKYWVIGGFWVCGALAWAASYRFMYHQLVMRHFWLLAASLALGWGLMLYATARHRLLNRKIYISRRVMYSFAAPFVFGVYLTVLGLVVFAMRFWGLEFPFVLQWMLLLLGLAALIIIAFSETWRRKVKFFISTHFYVNKYEYRDEWLNFTRRLRGALTEKEVVEALYQVLVDSLYTQNVCIWLGEETQGYRLAVSSKKGRPPIEDVYQLKPDDPLITYLKKHSYYYRLESKKNAADAMAFLERCKIASDLDLVMFTPLMIDEKMLGVIALGPEYTGGKYGTDDFDLLTALGTQTASALLAVRMAEELALMREQKAVDIMSAFILHDVKNAAGMLSLIRQNAPDYMDDPEFQQDMLETIDDALKRMAKVQTGLQTLKGEITPQWQDINLEPFLRRSLGRLKKRLQGLEIDLHCEASILIRTDGNLLHCILENLLLNSVEAGNQDVRVDMRCRLDSRGQVIIRIRDNGPGLPLDLAPETLFEPFKTTKPKGSGIGLWQVEQMVKSLKGAIKAANHPSGGAQFDIYLPRLNIDRHDLDIDND